jgi:hypothetical protein
MSACCDDPSTAADFWVSSTEAAFGSEDEAIVMKLGEDVVNTMGRKGTVVDSVARSQGL